MVANIAANMYGLCPNIYSNQIALNDLSGMNLSYPTGMCMDPVLSMNGSLFDSGNVTYPNVTPGMSAIPMTGLTLGLPGMGMPYGNYEDYFKQYEKYQDFMIDSQVRQQQKARNADLRLNAPQEGIQEQAEYLKDKIIRNEQQQIKQAYDAFVKSVRAMYGEDATEEQIQSRANALYKQATQGRSLIEDIRHHGRDSFTQGAIQSVTFGLFNRKTAEETVSELTGQPVGTEENAKKIAGNVVGGAAVGGGAFLLGRYALKAAGWAAKSRTAWGIALGAVAGGIAAIAGAK